MPPPASQLERRPPILIDRDRGSAGTFLVGFFGVVREVEVSALTAGGCFKAGTGLLQGTEAGAATGHPR
jgi:hypothetical protein